MSMACCEAAKRRQVCKDEQLPERENTTCQSGAIQIEHSTEAQTDLTMNDLAALEHDCQQRLNDVQETNKHQILSNTRRSEE